MALTPAQILDDELAALGLQPGANATAVNSALRAKYPQGLGVISIDPRTGLPYTKTTASDAGSGNLAGQIVGGAFLAETGAFLASGFTAAGAAATEGTSAAEGASATESAGAGAGAASTASSLASKATSIFKYSSLLAALADPQFAVRLIEIVGGLVLIFMGLRALTGNGQTISVQTASVARTAAKVAK